MPQPLGRVRVHPDPAVLRHVLPNGLTLVILEDHASPLVAFHAVVRTGSATEGEYVGSGISHVVEHMLFKGTQRRPVGAVEREARSYGGAAQGFTTYDTTSYQLTVNRSHWSEAADLLVDALFFPTLDPQELAKERDVVLRELRLRRDDPAQVAWDLLFAQAYRVHPYRIPIIGYEEPMSRLTSEDLRTYHTRHYLPNATVIGVVGAVDPEEVIRRFEALTEKLPPGRVALTPLPEEPMPVGPRESAQEADVQLATVAVGFASVSTHHPDLYALDLLSWIMGGGRGSRLERALKETGLVHSVGSWNYTPPHRGLLVISMRADPDRVEKAVEALFQELNQIRQKPIPEPELQAARKAFLREYLGGRQTVSGQASDLASYEVLVGDPLFALRYLEEMNRLGPDDLRRVAEKYLQPERATTVRLIPRGTAGALSRQAHPEEKEGQPSSIQKVTLANGMRVLLKADHRLPLVTFHVAMMGGVRFETLQTNGLSQLTARMLLRGTQRHPAPELIEELKRMGAEADPFSGRNSLGFTLQAVAEEAIPAASLLGEILHGSAFPAEELERERRLGLAGLKAQEEDPFSWGLRRLVATLFTQHPYRLDPSGSPEAWGRLTRDDTLNFYRQVADPRQMVLAVVGDFQPDSMRKTLEQALGNLKGGEQGPPRIPAEPPRQGPREHREVTPRREAVLLIGFPGISLEDPRLPAVDLAEAILSGGAGRLFTEVREKKGLAYTVGAFAVHGLDPGFFVLYAVADPAHLDEVRQALLAEVDRLRHQSVPAEELEEARQGLLGARRIARQSQAHQAAQMAGDEMYGLGFDFSQKHDERIAAVTAQEIRSAIRDLLDPDRCVVVIGQPGKSPEDSSERGRVEEKAVPAG